MRWREDPQDGEGAGRDAIGRSGGSRMKLPLFFCAPWQVKIQNAHGNGEGRMGRRKRHQAARESCRKHEKRRKPEAGVMQMAQAKEKRMEQ